MFYTLRIRRLLNSLEWETVYLISVKNAIEKLFIFRLNPS